MSTCTVAGTFTDPFGNAISGATVHFNTETPTLDPSNNLVMPKETTTTTASDGTWSLAITQGLSGFLTLDLVPAATSATVKYTFSMVIPSASTASFASCWVDSATFAGTVPAPLSFSNISGTLAASQLPTLTGDLTISAVGVATVNSIATPNIITLTNLAQVAAHTYLGNNTASTANVAAITNTQLTADLNQFTSTLQGVVPASGGGTINFLRADGAWANLSAGINRSVSTITTNTAAGSTPSIDYVYYCNGALTLTLPTAVGNTNLYTIKNISTSTVSIATTSSQTIDGTASPIQIKVQNVSLDLESDGANWRII